MSGAPGRGTRVVMSRFVDSAVLSGFVRLVGRSELLLFRSPVFCIPKSGEVARWIMDCRALNLLTSEIWPTFLTSVRVLVHSILKYSYLAELDGVSYFHQFDLPTSMLPYFGFNIGCRRYQQTTLPMGWKNAMAVACMASNVLVWDVGLCYCDNLFALGDDLLECQENLSEIRLRADKVGIDLADVQPPTCRPQILGLDLDLVTKKYRLQPSWLDKVKVSWNARGRTRRRWAVLVGQLVYGVYILGLPLGLLHLTLRWVSSTTCTWGTHMNIPAPVVVELKLVFAVLLANPWTHVDTTGTPPVAMVSADASPSGGAASLLTPTSHLTWTWNWDIPPEHQIHREAWATTIGLALAQAHLPDGPLVVVSDCVPWMSILTCGYSLSPLLQWMSTLCWKLLEERKFLTMPVCSKHHWDDLPSRLLEPDLEQAELVNVKDTYMHDTFSIFPSPPPIGWLTSHLCHHVCAVSSLMSSFASQCKANESCAFCP